MNQERQKTDAIADAVEIPEGATHSNGKRTFYMWSKDDGLFKWCLKTKSWWWVSYYYEDYIKPL